MHWISKHEWSSELIKALSLYLNETTQLNKVNCNHWQHLPQILIIFIKISESICKYIIVMGASALVNRNCRDLSTFVQLNGSQRRKTSNQIKSLLLSHHHSTCALVNEILESVLRTVQKQFTYIQYIFIQMTLCNIHIYIVHTVYY